MKMLKWFCMLSKRLYKKPSFVILLLLIPLCVALFSSAAQEESGFARIILAQEGNDPVATQIIEELEAERGVVLFKKADSVSAAMEEITAGRADEAWIFPENVEKASNLFILGKEDHIAKVITREENMALRLAREKISAVLYESAAKAYYLQFVRLNWPQLEDLSDEKLIAYFEQVSISEELFVYGDPAGNATANSEINYLTTPIRGLLAILMLLCGMAATLYYMQDTALGTFSWVRERKKGLTALCCILTAVLHVSVILLLSLGFSGLADNLLREVAVLLLYSLCCAGFCLVLKQIFVTIPAYAATFPLFTVVTVALCPVFIDLRKWAFFQHLLPPTYFVNASYDSKYFLYMPAYFLGCLALSALLSQLRRLVRK